MSTLTKLLFVFLVATACEEAPKPGPPAEPVVARVVPAEPAHFSPMHSGKEAVDRLRSRCQTDPNRGVAGTLQLVHSETGACATCWSGKCDRLGCMEDEELWTVCMSLAYVEDQEK